MGELALSVLSHELRARREEYLVVCISDHASVRETKKGLNKRRAIHQLQARFNIGFTGV